jgi:hypothetical protein
MKTRLDQVRAGRKTGESAVGLVRAERLLGGSYSRTQKPKASGGRKWLGLLLRTDT